ncbi:ABC transporter ATP-binding protein [Lysinibacillus macroides]|uniref:Peptide ABC transporter ATP-binding protein n=1 Tax=Lysinibacillus macroides TaxID=33935 RepID=A0A0M9DLV1_9BACI|nr:ABC transporter ATP-binding protein [Lysinibacillus macroides]KOY83056.1 peptide ABC transporter ATP-binding protein [Lysinibacillus macroides]QPR70090.1 ABC transporter ATP-binding protein [Lysinibacillus macroides]
MLKVENVDKSYKTHGFLKQHRRKILTNINLECQRGECLGIIGESGSGKSTLGRLLIGIEQPDCGVITIHGKQIRDRKQRKGHVSVVFQDYRSSINPFYSVEKAILEPLRDYKMKEISDELLDRLLLQVGLSPDYKYKYPYELSGGEAQRVCIARAIATEPTFILLDEAISSLDVSVQLQILDLLKTLKSEYNMGYIFITHDLQAAAYICDRMMIFKDGQVQETIATKNLPNVQSSYARKLLQNLITF